MTRKLMMGKTRALAASLVLAGSAIFGTAASAQYTPSGECWDNVVALCDANYQAWGYRTSADCSQHEWCYFCAGGYLCGYDPRDYYTAAKPDTGRPW